MEELGLSFHLHTGPRDGIQAVRFVQQVLHPPSHLASLRNDLNNDSLEIAEQETAELMLSIWDLLIQSLLFWINAENAMLGMEQEIK